MINIAMIIVIIIINIIIIHYYYYFIIIISSSSSNNNNPIIFVTSTIILSWMLLEIQQHVPAVIGPFPANIALPGRLSYRFTAEYLTSGLVS